MFRSLLYRSDLKAQRRTNDKEVRIRKTQTGISINQIREIEIKFIGIKL